MLGSSNCCFMRCSLLVMHVLLLMASGEKANDMNSCPWSCVLSLGEAMLREYKHARPHAHTYSIKHSKELTRTPHTHSHAQARVSAHTCSTAIHTHTHMQHSDMHSHTCSIADRRTDRHSTDSTVIHPHIPHAANRCTYLERPCPSKCIQV